MKAMWIAVTAPVMAQRASVPVDADKSLPALKARNLPAARVPVDLFRTVQNYHDIPNNGAGEPALRAFDAAVLKLRKKGGTYAVIDHADAPGTGMAHTGTSHRSGGPGQDRPVRL